MNSAPRYLLLLAATAAISFQTPVSETWTFDRLTSIGGHPATILGHPHVIETPQGKAIQFNGVDDAIFLDVHPLAGAETFTWEVVFRPDGDGPAAQRFFHMQEKDPKTGEDTMSRLLLETRVTPAGWYLDAFALSGAESKALVDPKLLHTVDAWHHAAMVYDGKELRSYVDGKLEGSAPLHLTPHGAGHTSVGVRINRKDYFKGAIRIARISRKALPPSEFIKW